MKQPDELCEDPLTSSYYMFGIHVVRIDVCGDVADISAISDVIDCRKRPRDMKANGLVRRRGVRALALQQKILHTGKRLTNRSVLATSCELKNSPSGLRESPGLKLAGPKVRPEVSQLHLLEGIDQLGG